MGFFLESFDIKNYSEKVDFDYYDADKNGILFYSEWENINFDN